MVIHSVSSFFPPFVKERAANFTRNSTLVSIFIQVLLKWEQDPDPHKSEKSDPNKNQGKAGSGSAWIRNNLSCWIRIRIQIADSDPGGQK
jgi:hypothetical protein